MKVKKLLTVLALTTMLTACSFNNGGDETDDGGNTPVVEQKFTVSFDANGGTGSMTDVADVKGQYTLPACTFTAPEGKEFAGWKVNGQGETLAAGAAIEVAADVQLVAQWGLIRALSSISLEGPTKTAYNAGEEIDLTGLVVTAHYNDNTTEVVPDTAYTTNAAELDMKASGSKQVTVTYNGLTENFTITVAAPTDWSAEVKALFEANIYGATVPFFYSYDLGLDDLQWQDQDDQVIAIGGQIAANDQYTLEECEDVLSVFDDAEWTIIEDGVTTWYFEAQLKVKVEDNDRYVDAKFGALNLTTGRWGGSGNFALILKDPFLYSWADSNLETIINTAFDIEVDIPDLPAGVRFSKDDISLAPQYAYYYKYIPITVYGADEDYAEAYLSALSTNEWEVFTEDGEVYTAVSPDGKLRIDGYFDEGEFVLEFSKQAAIPDYVASVAEIFNRSKYQFELNTREGDYVYDFEVELGEGETLTTLFTNYADILLADTTAEFVKRGETKTKDTVVYGKFDSEVLGARVYIYAYSYTEGEGDEAVTTYGVEITVEEYVPVPAKFAAVAAVLGVDEGEFNYTAATLTTSEYVWAQLPIGEGVTLAEALAAYTNLLEADTTLEFEALYEVEDVTMSGGVQGKRVEYANDDTRVEFLAYGSTVQIAIYHYDPAPHSDWIDAVLAKFAAASFTLTWDSDDQAYEYGNYITIPEETTIPEFASYIASLILSDETLGFYALTDNGDAKEYTILLFSEDGFVEVVASTYYGASPALLITFGLNDSSKPEMVNAIAAAFGINVTLVDDTYYVGTGRFAFSDTYSISQYGKAIMDYYIADKLLSATALGFEAGTEEDDSGIIAQEGYFACFYNDEGYEVDILLIDDGSGNYSGNYQVIIVPPSETPEP